MDWFFISILNHVFINGNDNFYAMRCFYKRCRFLYEGGIKYAVYVRKCILRTSYTSNTRGCRFLHQCALRRIIPLSISRAAASAKNFSNVAPGGVHENMQQSINTFMRLGQRPQRSQPLRHP